MSASLLSEPYASTGIVLPVGGRDGGSLELPDRRSPIPHEDPGIVAAPTAE
jgi:hypothetical protein